jgi:uncharacterized protein YbjT (DUF2867 family)
MRVLVLGGYGFIGAEAARRLIAHGHDVVGLGRDASFGARLIPQAAWIGADIASLSTPAHWAPHLHRVDCVVNAAGALQDGMRDNLQATQDVAIRALIAACEQHPIQRFVQISAPGASAASSTQFLRTKAVADSALKASTLDWVILRPGLVWGRTAYGGTELLRLLAGLPWLQILVLPHSRVQLVDIDDVSDATCAAVEAKVPAGVDVDLVADEILTLTDLVARVRAWLGLPPAAARIVLPESVGFALARVADLAGWLGWRSPLRTTALRAMKEDVIGDPAPWRAITGAPLTPFAAALAAHPATRQERLFARIELIVPIVVLCLSAFWIASGAIGLGHIDAAASVLPLPADAARTMVIAGAIADIALGLAILWRPWARGACFAMAALTALYLAAGTWLAPHLWADPLGVFVKAIPAALLALLCAAQLEER